MRIIVTILVAAMSFISATASTFSYKFNNTPVAEAIVRISKEHPELNISFIYKELDLYKTSAQINTDDAYEALQQTIGFNPITIRKSDNAYYIEALQRGKYIYRGQLMGSDNEPVASATVILLNPNDSTAITYGVSDAAGHFSIPCDKNNVIAKFSSVGYKTTYRHLKSFNAGTIVMLANAISLSSVSIEAKSAMAYQDRTVYIPTQRQKNAAQNATDLLQFMAIPQIKVSVIDNSVTDNFGKEVTMFINGMLASKEELEGLRTADVRRVEYLEYPIDPRFNGAERVVNFIVQDYAYGGYTKATVNESVLTGLLSRLSVFSKFSYKKMNYDIFVGTNNWDNHHVGSSISGRYRLKCENGDEVIARRNEILDKTHFKEDMLPVTFRATYKTDKIQIRNTVGFVHDNTSVFGTEGSVQFSEVKESQSTFKRSNPNRKNSAIYMGYLYFSMPKDAAIAISPSVTYTHSDDRFRYEAVGRNPIVRNANEDAWNIRLDSDFRKQLGKRHSILIGIHGGQWRNNLHYSGSVSNTDRFKLNFAFGMLAYNYRVSKISINTDLGFVWEGSDINGTTLNDYYPFSHINVQYSPNRKHQLSAALQFATNSPSISEKASDILQENEYLYISGNPLLKNSRHITLSASYSWLPSNILNLTAYSDYFTDFNRRITVYSPYKDGEAVIRDFRNNGNYSRIRIGVNANLKLLEGKLQLTVRPVQYFYRSTGIYDTHYNPFVLSTQAVMYLNRFYAIGTYSTPQRELWSGINTIYRERNLHTLGCGWSDNNWNLRFTAYNFLNKGWVGATLDMSSRYYSEERINYGLSFHPRLNLTVTYTINYGKKIQRGNEIGEQTGTSSGILK